MTDIDKGKSLADDDGFRGDYAARTTWAQILEPHGWELRSSDSQRGEGWARPGQDARTTGRTRSGAFTREHGPLVVFTISTEFEAGKSYSKFDAYAILNHRADRQAAAMALYSQDFGVFRERDINGNQIVRCGRYS